jgi:hypothetical protein
MFSEHWAHISRKNIIEKEGKDWRKLTKISFVNYNSSNSKALATPDKTPI